MRSIQDVGIEILGMNPGKMYIFTGSNFGIKRKYIEIVKEVYGGKFLEADSIDYLIKLANTKRIIPLQPTVYISRYDAKFISELNDKTKTQINSLSKLPGTVIILYDDTKHCDKVEKYLSDLCTRFEDVSPNIIKKYLSKDYPNIPDSILDLVINKSTDYARCDTLCRQLSTLSTTELAKLTDSDITMLFYLSSTYSNDRLKQAVIHRNTDYLFRYTESGNDLSDFPYVVMNAMVDVEKELSAKLYKKSGDVRSSWTFESAYNLHDITYKLFMKSRSETVNLKNIVCLLISLLRYNPIPAWEDIQNDAI